MLSTPFAMIALGDFIQTLAVPDVKLALQERLAPQNRTHCDPCEAGKYNDWSAGTSCYSCWSVVSADRTSCDSCPAGKALITASPNYCEDCSPGRYSLWSGSYSCQACPLGRYSNEIALSELCSACPGLATENTSSTSIESLHPAKSKSKL